MSQAKPKIRNALTGRVRTPALVGARSLTQQNMLESTNINNIMDKYHRHGLIDHVSKHQGQYGDFTIMPDFQTAMNKLNEAQAMFDTLPAATREIFDNDPGKFLDFATDPENLEEMREMGLAPPAKKPPEPQKVQVVSQEPIKGSSEPGDDRTNKSGEDPGSKRPKGA